MDRSLIVIEQIKGTDIIYKLRPTYKGWGIYKPVGVNQAELIYESEEKESCIGVLQQAEACYV